MPGRSTMHITMPASRQKSALSSRMGYTVIRSSKSTNRISSKTVPIRCMSLETMPSRTGRRREKTRMTTCPAKYKAPPKIGMASITLDASMQYK